MIALLWLLGCGEKLPADQPCIEVGTAIANRTETCTGKRGVALDRLDLFEDEYLCVADQVDVKGEEEADLYECAFIVRNLACELVEDYGDDFERWLDSSESCAQILEPK